MKLWENAMNEISPDLLSGAMEYEKDAAAEAASKARAAKDLRKKWIPAAACLLLGVLLVGGGLWFNGKNRKPTDYSAIWQADEPLREGSVLESYQTIINDAPYTAYQSSRICDPALVGEKLGDVTVRGGWYRFIDEGRTVTVDPVILDPSMAGEDHLNAEVFAIRGVAPKIAVCLKFSEAGEVLTTDRYYSHFNAGAAFGTLSAFFSGTQAAERLRLIYETGYTSLSVETASAKGISRRSYYTDDAAAESIVKALLDCDGPASAAEEETILTTCEKRASFRIDIEGIGNWRVTLYGSGYLKLEPSGITLLKAYSFLYQIGNSAENLIRLLEQVGTPYGREEGSTVTATTSDARPE
ncbi:MAG: hypothetical protein J5496_03390 [Lachnospiraceae bacterium]|nr:hypothetical protein [Lachnospiraceae bacterium]